MQRHSARRARVLLTVLPILSIVACSDSATTPGSDWAVDRLVLESTSLSASSIGEIVQASARPLDRNGAQIMQIGLSWSSSDSTVLRSEGNGRFRALRNGTAIVNVGLATDAAFPTRTAMVVVRQQAAGIAFHVDTVRLYAIGQKTILRARVIDALGTEIVGAVLPTLRSTDNKVAVVDSTGLITAKDDGDVLISATSGAVSAHVVTRVKSTIRFTGCVTSSNVTGASCRTVLLSTQAQR